MKSLIKTILLLGLVVFPSESYSSLLTCKLCRCSVKRCFLHFNTQLFNTVTRLINNKQYESLNTYMNQIDKSYMEYCIRKSTNLRLLEGGDDDWHGFIKCLSTSATLKDLSSLFKIAVMVGKGDYKEAAAYVVQKSKKNSGFKTCSIAYISSACEEITEQEEEEEEED